MTYTLPFKAYLSAHTLPLSGFFAKFRPHLSRRATQPQQSAGHGDTLPPEGLWDDLGLTEHQLRKMAGRAQHQTLPHPTTRHDLEAARRFQFY